MNNKPDVRLIDTHAKGNGGADHLYIFTQKLVLSCTSEFTIKSGMISNGLNSVSIQNIRQLFCCFSVQRINNAALLFHPFDKTDNVLIGLGFFYFWQHFIIKIGPVE